MDRSCLEPVHLHFLRTTHELSERGDSNGAEFGAVQRALGLDEEQGETILEGLVETGLVVWPAQGQILMSQAGTELIEYLAGNGAASIAGISDAALGSSPGFSAVDSGRL